VDIDTVKILCQCDVAEEEDGLIRERRDQRHDARIREVLVDIYVVAIYISENMCRENVVHIYSRSR
jgi:hypothetical protein